MAGGNFSAADEGGSEYPGKLTSYVAITCIMAAIGGLIFGYDIEISGRVTSMDLVLKFFFPLSLLLSIRNMAEK